MSLVIVLDPGHGSSEYEGAKYDNYIEKDMALAVSKVIKDRLEKYDGVTVILTRDSDISVGLKERCDIAKAVNADYFFSIHFNSSSQHNLFGSEVWLSVNSVMYNRMFPIANELINSFSERGLSIRGIKTRLGNGNNDYYAVIKNSTAYNIPSCIIEHCYLDNLNDTLFLNNRTASEYAATLTSFGISDADAIAKGLHLKSTELGIDYSDYKTVKSSHKGIVRPDSTSPNINEVSLVSTDLINSSATLKIKASDKNGYIQYYQYSIDGGNTYSGLIPWPKTAWNKSIQENIITIKADLSHDFDVSVIVYNGYDIPLISNLLHINKQSYTLSNMNIELNTLTKNTKNEHYFSYVFENGIMVLGITALLLLVKIKQFGKDK